MKKNIAILWGGNSAERVISEMSAALIVKNIDKERYDAVLVDIDGSKWTAKIDNNNIDIDKNDFSVPIEHGKALKFDAIFMMIHGTPCEDGLLQAYFDMLSIPYVASGPAASTLTFNKWMTTSALKYLDVPCANSVLLRKDDKIDEEAIVKALGLPCFIKPNSAGSSFGVTKAKNSNAITDGLKKVWEHDHEALIETFMEGREVTCGLFKHGNTIEVLGITEIVTENEFFDYNAKYLGESKEITPAPIDETVAQKVRDLSVYIFEKLDLKSVARIDYILINDEPHVIEVNTVPGMSSESLIPQQVVAKGYTIKDFINILIENASN